MSSVRDTNSGIFESGLLIDIKPTSPPRKNGQKMAWTKDSNISDRRSVTGDYTFAFRLSPSALKSNALPPPAFVEPLGQRLAGARAQFLRLRFVVEDVGARLVADGDHGHGRVVRRNLERGARLVRVPAAHLVDDQPQRDRLQRHRDAAGAGVVLRPAV